MYESGYASPNPMFGPLFFVFAAALYLFFALALYKIAQKCDHKSEAWWGFVPILNVFLIIKCASRPLWWFVLLLVPIVNIVVSVMLWMDVARNVNQSPVWGVLTLVPLVNLVAVGYLGFSSMPQKSFFQPQEPSTRETAGVR